MLKRSLVFLPFIVFAACIPIEGVAPAAQTSVVQTITATIWTVTPATPTATREPMTGKIVEILNNTMIGVDPLADTVGARFSVLDAQILHDEPSKQAGILSIHVECDWVYSDSCTPEETFVVLVHSLTTDKKVVEKVSEQMPSTIHTLQVVSFERMIQTGMIIVEWKDVVDYTEGRISGNQLGSRIFRLTNAP